MQPDCGNLDIVDRMRRDGWAWFALMVGEVTEAVVRVNTLRIDGHISLLYVRAPDGPIPHDMIEKFLGRGKNQSRTVSKTCAGRRPYWSSTSGAPAGTTAFAT